jgi:hypothetical protein
MPKLPGTFDGSRYPDLRIIHMSLPLCRWYVLNHLWDKITKVTSGDMTTTIRLDNGEKHQWKNNGWQKGHTLTIRRISTNEKVRSHSVLLSETKYRVPENWPMYPSREQIYKFIGGE